MANKKNIAHRENFPLPKGELKVHDPTGGSIVSDYSHTPIQDRFNPDRGQMWPEDPRQKKD